MSAGNANLINALCLIIMGMWGWKISGSNTALIPVGFGAALLVMTNLIRIHHKIVSHLAVVLTLVVLVAVAGMRLPKAISNGDNMQLLRAGAMTLTGVIAMIAFIKSFIDARKAKAGR